MSKEYGELLHHRYFHQHEAGADRDKVKDATGGRNWRAASAPSPAAEWQHDRENHQHKSRQHESENEKKRPKTTALKPEDNHAGQVPKPHYVEEIWGAIEDWRIFQLMPGPQARKLVQSARRDDCAQLGN